MNLFSCSVKSLPKREHVAAAHTAWRENPVNRPSREALALATVALSAEGRPPSPQRISVLATRYWGPANAHFTVGFLERTSARLADRILTEMNAWAEPKLGQPGANVSFQMARGAARKADVRITRAGDGYWSYLGTDIRHIPFGRPTMCLQDFTLQTPDSEYKRVVRHETGHTLGCPHEHMRAAIVARIDRQKAIDYFGRTQGWDMATVVAQVLMVQPESTLIGLPADEVSIMCYDLPGSITKDGEPILGGMDIDAEDQQLIARLYPVAA